MRTCLFATCHTISNVLSRPPCFHANVSTTRRVHVRVRALTDGCEHTFWLTKTCLCVTFNIWHNVCRQISHSHSRNNVQPHDLTYKPFLVCNFSHTKSCATTLVWPTRRTVVRVHCEKTSLYATFWLTWTCPHANILIGGRVVYNLPHNFLCLCSTGMFPRSVSATRRVHARVRTQRRVCAHFFDLRSHVYA